MRVALRPYRRYIQLTLGITVVITALFLVVEALQIDFLTHPENWLDDAGVPAALLGVGLLLFDVFIPVPSSVIMIANGALFGV
ncbi:MAG: hypothetical protein ACRDHN_15455, partial [Thermomicrobiales bacterium]